MTPNPFTDRATITYTVNSESDVMIEVYSMLGTKVKTLVTTKQAKGTYQTELDLSDMNIQDGIYLLKYENDGHSFVKRIIKNRD
jgi:serine protease AprX